MAHRAGHPRGEPRRPGPARGRVRDNTSFTYVLADVARAYAGCLYLYPLGRRTPLTDELLRHDVDVSWWVTPAAYDAGRYRDTCHAVRAWTSNGDLPFTAPYHSNVDLP